MVRLPVRPRPACAPVPRVEPLERRRLLDAVPHDPGMMDEHSAVMALVPDAAVTHAAVRSGAWSDPGTWGGSQVPGAGANVLVPAGLAVVFDRIDPAPLRTVRVDGTLSFATAQGTQLTVDTLVVTPAGALVIGTASEPVRDDVTARVVFADRGAIDTTWDPRLFSRGLVSMGTTSVFGSARTGFAALAGPATRGTHTLVLAEAPQNWKAGDTLALSGTSAIENQDETLKVVAVQGRFVRVDRPLAWTHAAPRVGLPVYVADVSRNVVFASENQQTGRDNVARRGHVMFLHTPHVDVNNAAFDHLGRTDKSVRINDPRLDSAGRLVPGTGTNARARYAVHFHRAGTEGATGPAAVRGSVVEGGAGWGFVNHSSDVVFEDDVSHDVAGAGFVAEAGDEVGAFRHNLALRSAGTGAPDVEGIESRKDVQDFGHEGNGFWFQGPGTEVEGNVAAGQRDGGFVYFTRGLEQANLGTTRFRSSNLTDPSQAGGEPSVNVGDVPIKLFRNNYAYACGDAFESWYHLMDGPRFGRSTVEGFVTWGNRFNRAVFLPYTRNVTVRNLRAVSRVRAPYGFGVARNDFTANLEIENARVEGFEVGIMAPSRGDTTVRGGWLNNVQNVQAGPALEAGRSVDVSAVRFGHLPPESLKGRAQYDLFFDPGANTFAPANHDLAPVFATDTIRVNGSQAYRPEQAADFVPYPAGAASTPAYVPRELLNRTNRQLWAIYGLAVGGAGAPGYAADPGRPRSNLLLGDLAADVPEVRLDSVKYTRRIADYPLAYTVEGGAAVVDPSPPDLRPGWNVLTRLVEGRRRSVFVYGDVAPPAVVSARPGSMNPLALPRGVTVLVRVLDDSIGETIVTHTYTDLSTRPVQTRPDGSRYIALDFQTSDLAGNLVSATLELTLDPSAPM